QDVNEVSAKVHGAPVAKDRISSTDVDEKKVKGLFDEHSDDCGALSIDGQAGNGDPKDRDSLGHDSGGGSQGHDGGDVESAAQLLAPSTRRQRRRQEQQEDE
ncbi:unnamed protein product, partial [Prorocentrum cordatum]